MDNKLDLAGLDDMLWYASEVHRLGYRKVKMDSEHAIEILERLIAFEKNSQQ